MSLDAVSSFLDREFVFQVSESPEYLNSLLINKIMELEQIIEIGKIGLLHRDSIDPKELAKTLTPSVVRIYVERDRNTLYKEAQQVEIYSGTGFLISSDGYIVTNHHVIESARKVMIFLNDREDWIPAVVWGSDPGTDIALLKIEGSEHPYVCFAPEDVEVGEKIFSIGNPLKMRNLFTQGIVGSVGDAMIDLVSNPITAAGGYSDYIITDALMDHGNSGGPIFNFNGEVVGVSARVISGFSGHTSSKLAQRVINQLMEKHFVSRSFFGANVIFVDWNSSKFFNHNGLNGLVVSDLLEGSPASNAGLRLGDVILEYNGKIPTTRTKFFFDLSSKDSLELKVLRQGEVIDLRCPLNTYKINFQTQIERLGASIEEFDGDKAFLYGFDSSIKGVLVSSSKISSRIKPGMVITGIYIDLSQPVISIKSVEELCRAVDSLDNSTPIILEVRTENQSRSKYIEISI